MKWDRLSGMVLLAGAAFALGMAALSLMRRPAPEPIEIIPPAPSPLPAATETPQPTPTAAPLAVYVSGAVANPAVYRLPPGSIADDAVTAAGGFTPQADPVAVNLAMALVDGMQLHVPEIDEEPLDLPTAPAPAPAAPGRSVELFAGLVNLNSATAAELEALPGIGPALAANILAYRAEHGPFSAIEQIKDVSGIGDAKFESIRELIDVGP